MQHTADAPGPRLDVSADQDPWLQIELAYQRAIRQRIIRQSAFLIVFGLLATTPPITSTPGAVAFGVGCFLAPIALWSFLWGKRVAQMIRGEHWQQVTVTMLVGSPKAIRATRADGTCVDLKARLHPGQIEAGGRSWLISPDPGRRALLRLPGALAPVTAKRLEPSNREMIDHLPSSAGLPEHASDDQMASGMAVMSRVSILLGYGGLFCVFVTVLGLHVYAAAETGAMSVTGVLAAAAAGTAILILTASWWVKYRDRWALPQLLRRGPWWSVPARLLEPYRLARSGAATIRFATSIGQDELVFEVRWAAPGLAAYIQQTGTVWFAGSAHNAGKPVAVGAPRQPFVNVAREVS